MIFGDFFSKHSVSYEVRNLVRPLTGKLINKQSEWYGYVLRLLEEGVY